MIGISDKLRWIILTILVHDKDFSFKFHASRVPVKFAVSRNRDDGLTTLEVGLNHCTTHPEKVKGYVIEVVLVNL